MDWTIASKNVYYIGISEFSILQTPFWLFCLIPTLTLQIYLSWVKRLKLFYMDPTVIFKTPFSSTLFILGLSLRLHSFDHRTVTAVTVKVILILLFIVCLLARSNIHRNLFFFFKIACLFTISCFSTFFITKIKKLLDTGQHNFGNIDDRSLLDFIWLVVKSTFHRNDSI